MNNYEHFSKLCESIVTEVSTAMAEFKGPGAQEVLKYLHQSQAFGHDVDIRPLARPKWADLRSPDYADSWFLISGTKGFVAAKFAKGSYRNTGTFMIFASNGTPDPEEGNMVYSTTIDSAVEANNYVKSFIGDAKKYYIAQSEYSTTLRSTRKANKPTEINDMHIVSNKLVQRFKPLFNKILVASRADVNGVISSMVKNDAHHRAEKKIEHLNLIDRSIDELQDGQISDFLKDAVGNSLMMTARYYYPDKTGNISSSYGYRNYAYSSESSEGVKQVLKDIQSGDRQKLSAVLAYLKRSLI